jgi:hypothetical protein
VAGYFDADGGDEHDAVKVPPRLWQRHRRRTGDQGRRTTEDADDGARDDTRRA